MAFPDDDDDFGSPGGAFPPPGASPLPGSNPPGGGFPPPGGGLPNNLKSYGGGLADDFPSAPPAVGAGANFPVHDDDDDEDEPKDAGRVTKIWIVTIGAIVIIAAILFIISAVRSYLSDDEGDTPAKDQTNGVQLAPQEGNQQYSQQQQQVPTQQQQIPSPDRAPQAGAANVLSASKGTDTKVEYSELKKSPARLIDKHVDVTDGQLRYWLEIALVEPPQTILRYDVPKSVYDGYHSEGTIEVMYRTDSAGRVAIVK